MNLLATTNQPLTMSSREIADLTGKQHSHVFRDIRKMLDSLDDEHQEYIQIWTHPQNKQSYEEYILDRDYTDCLLTGYSVKARMIVIKRWKELENIAAPTLPNFSDPAQAARAWAEQYEANVIKQQQLEIAAPKVEFHDKVVNDAATFSLRDAAKKIQQRPNKFSEWLRSEGYLCQNNLPKQQYINQGLFKTHTGQSKDEFQFSQARVTSKGLSYFTKKLGDKKL